MLPAAAAAATRRAHGDRAPLLVPRIVTMVVLVATLIVLPSVPAGAWTRLPIRVAGDDRYETAIQLSRAVFPNGAPTVFVATGEAFPDALAGAAAAGVNHSPLLLTQSTSLPDSVAAELHRLAPKSIVVMGGVNAVANTVLDQIRTATGVTPARVAGDTRYATAAATAAFYPTGTGAFVATGSGFADALASAAAAGILGRPMLLVQQDSIPAATAAALQRLAPQSITVVGGSGVVNDTVLGALGAYSPSVQRVAGPDRYATAAAVASEFFPSPSEVLLASGLSFPDALAAGAAGAQLGEPVLLSLQPCVPVSTVSWLQSTGWPNVTGVGGANALGDAAVDVQPCSPVPDGPIAPGVRLDTVVLDGPNVVHIVTIDRTQGMSIRSTLATGRLTSRVPTSQIARRWNAAVAVNGDFFTSDGQPAHAFATGGRLIRAPGFVEDQAGFSSTDPKEAFFGTPAMTMTAEVVETDVTTTIEHFNDADPNADELAMYTPEGATVRRPPVGSCAARLTPTAPAFLDAAGRAVQNHVVAAVSCGSDPGVAGTDDVLVAQSGGSRAAFIQGLSAGQHVNIAWQLQPQWPGLLDATGSNTTLVHNGAPSDDIVLGDGPFYATRAPRTAVGTLADGRVVLVTVDGRQPGYSVGMTPAELADYLVSIGVKEATNLDGGGSTTLAVNGLLVNRPSDAAGERAVGNALVVVPVGTPDPPEFGPGIGGPIEADSASDPASTDVASMGGWAAMRQSQGYTLSPAMADDAARFDSSRTR